ncbi:DUF2117 domain-containing protein [Desulfosarcina ovata]|uniref:DUF2117 domain-containing protein n=1 Tax=Desulfosarcina ovata subsp. ovata TaxID=2752305 RepID=A0A5K8AFM3_9BACT|nr:DUF2117 domain-containing protein [Desulfosarcina ovata]BBO91306.1 hypothetical protein DSCOOX_44860 [Desulfosarcina ovata subsp. ovata]
MIGILFHGPEVFDSGWGRQIIDTMKTKDDLRCVLAGTMGRTAVFDSGIDGIEFWNQMPSACLSELASEASLILIVNFAKSAEAGLVFGGMVVERSGVTVPVVQVECSGPFWVEWVDGCDPGLIETLHRMGLSRRAPKPVASSIWQADGNLYRRMTTAGAGDFIFVDGIMVGRATGDVVTLISRDGQLCEIQGADVKAHGLEKLERFGGVDLQTAKLASSPTIRRTAKQPRIMKTTGNGLVFIDHAGMHVYELTGDVEGAVTVGDDTTVVVGDILSRFQIPVIGIVDGDEDVILENGRFASGSAKLTVRADDRFGMKVFDEIFNHEKQIGIPFEEALRKIVKLAGDDLVNLQTF